MKIGIMQPYFFPYLGYFQNIAACDEYVICDQVQYVKEGWVVRNQIPGNSERGAVYFRPQIQRPSNSVHLIDQVKLSQDVRWRKKLLKSLWHVYNKAAHVEGIYPFVESLIQHRPDTLSEFNYHSIRSICDLLGIETKLSFNSPVLQQVEEELDDLMIRYQAKDPHIDRKQVRVLEFCKRYPSDQYVNNYAGNHLYFKETFAANGIALSFVKSNPVTYPQFHGKPFVPNLSVIDMLMHLGAEGTRRLLAEYELV